MEKPNNKEGRPFEFYHSLYQSADINDIIKRCAVQYADNSLRLTFIGNNYAISHPQFTIKLLEERVPADVLSSLGPGQILIIRYLIEGRAIPALGKWLTYREMPWGELYNDNFTGRCIKRLAFSFGNQLAVFEQIMESLGAVAIKGGDIAFELELLPGLSIRYLLWAGDDEFPPSSQILFSDNFSAAFSAEDMAVVGDVTINAMKEAGKRLGLC